MASSGGSTPLNDSRNPAEGLPAAFGAALLAMQKDMPDLQKNAINPHFKSKYISLDSLMEQVLPVLHRHGFVLMQFPTTLADGSPALRTQLLHTPTMRSVEDTMPLVLGKNDPQGQGSAITYARRYATMAFLSLVADVDDDANQASPRTQKGAAPSRRTKADAFDASDAANYPNTPFDNNPADF